MRRPTDEISIIVSVTNTGSPVFRGTAFPAIACGMWITAAHCVKLKGQETLGLYSAISRRLEEIAKIHTHPDLDVALLRGVSDDTTPFTVTDRTAWGSDIEVVGYPEDLFLDDEGKQRPQARMLKGHIQRIESDTSVANARGDFELSVATPGGMSGSPVVLQSDGNVAGLVIGNNESYVQDHLTETVSENGSKTVHEVQRAVSFGAALDLRRVLDWIPTLDW